MDSGLQHIPHPQNPLLRPHCFPNAADLLPLQVEVHGTVLQSITCGVGWTPLDLLNY